MHTTGKYSTSHNKGSRNCKHNKYGWPFPGNHQLICKRGRSQMNAMEMLNAINARAYNYTDLWENLTLMNYIIQ